MIGRLRVFETFACWLYCQRDSESREAVVDERGQITYMQVRIARIFAASHGISLAEAARMLDAAGAFRYIADCWGLFHVEGDEAVLHEVEQFMSAKGATE